MSSEDKAQAQVAKATFVKHIDRIYKISDPKGSFLYGDMQSPQPDRTLRMLKLLLNYLFYYNMLKEEVKGRVKPYVDTFNQKKTQLNSLNVELEKLNIKKENVRRPSIPLLLCFKIFNFPLFLQELKLMTDNQEEESALRKQHEQMKGYSKKLEEDIAKLEKALVEYSPVMRCLSQKADSLSAKLVDEFTAEQLRALQQQLMNLKTELEENEGKIHLSASNTKESIRVLKENNQTIDTLLNDLKEIYTAVGWVTSCRSGDTLFY